MTLTTGYNLRKLEVILNDIFPDRIFKMSADRYGINVGYYFKNGNKFEVEDESYDKFQESLMEVLSTNLDSFSLSNLSTYFMGYTLKECAI